MHFVRRFLSFTFLIALISIGSCSSQKIQSDESFFISQYSLEFSAGEIFYIYTKDETLYKLVMVEANSTKIRAKVLQINGLDTDAYVEEIDIDDIQELEKIRPPPPKPKPGLSLLVGLGSFVLGIVLGLAILFAI